MSDLFVSEILILFFITVTLLRPFSNLLKTASAVLLFPFFAVVLSLLTIFGQGLYFSLALIFIFSIVVFLFLLPKTFSFITNLPTHLYSISEIIINSSLLVITVLFFFLVFYSAPERTVNIQGKVVSQYVELDSYPEKTFGTANILPDASSKNICIIFLPSVKYASYDTNSISTSLLNEGYKVITLNTLLGENSFLPKNFYNFSKALKLFSNRLLKKDTSENLCVEPFSQPENEIIDILDGIINKFAQDSDVYIFSEGVYNTFLLNYIAKSTLSLSKNIASLLICDSSFEIPSTHTGYVVESSKQVLFDSRAKATNLFVIKQDDAMLPYFCELRGDDILATRLLQSTPDIARVERKKITEIFEKWITIKQDYYSSEAKTSKDEVLYGGK